MKKWSDDWQMLSLSAKINFVMTMVFIALLFLFIAYAISTAHADAVCLTKKEARQLWPRKHIYWYSKDHCWSDRRGGSSRNLRIDPIKKVHAELLPAPVYNVLPRPRPVIVMVEEDLEGCCWPPLGDDKEQALQWLTDRLKYETQNTQENSQRR